MDINIEIKKAKFVAAPKEFAAPVILREFNANNVSDVKIAVSALGFFIPFVNGRRVGEDYFLPSQSLFAPRNSSAFTYPVHDKFTYRCYYTVYDITDYIKEGKNVLEVMLGDGRYRQTERTAEGNVSFGDSLAAIYAICITDKSGEHVIRSDGSEMCRSSEITSCNLFYGEVYDSRIKTFKTAKCNIISMPETVLSPEIVPPDRVIKKTTAKMICEKDGKKIYDVGENISGFVKLKVHAGKNERVSIRFAESLKDGKLDFESTGSFYKSPNGAPQIMEDIFIGDGNDHMYEPRFVWHAFRYFEISGNAEPCEVCFICNDLKQNAEFKSSSAELNWLFETFLRTQRDNMHGGVPLDCPHRERLGYTGDGQVCAPTAMLFLDGRNFYKKWICDIFDSQDKVSGHINHTAPFEGGGGGPGGWGMAAITVPYNYYKIYGDISPARNYYDNIKRWIEYLIGRSEDGLIVREEDGGWCLGDWCTLEKTEIDESFVNTCLFIRALYFMEELAEKLGNFNDVKLFEEYIVSASNGVKSRFFDEKTGSFAKAIQGADAFALAANLGDERTLENLKEKYKSLGYFDTGFLATDLLTRILFDNNACDIAFELLTTHKIGGFGYMMEHGATTLWESWKGNGSLNHPMFGASSRMLLHGILGIEQEKNSAGFEKLLIAPKIPSKLSEASGSVDTVRGKISVEWKKRENFIDFKIIMPKKSEGRFKFGDIKRDLSEGTNIFAEELSKF